MHATGAVPKAALCRGNVAEALDEIFHVELALADAAFGDDVVFLAHGGGVVNVSLVASPFFFFSRVSTPLPVLGVLFDFLGQGSFLVLTSLGDDEARR